MLPTRSPLPRLCLKASRVLSPIASRSHWLTAPMMVITRRPAADPVSSDSATEISATLRFSNSSSSRHKSFTLRVPGTFIGTGSTTVPRFAHTATLLNDGRVLIVCGGAGVGFRNGIAGAEIYDPAARTFSPAGGMTGARGWHTATLLADGRVLLAGGFDGRNDLASAEIFDPATGTFTATGDMITAKRQHTATLLRTGKVLVNGGLEYRSSELYDPATGAFTPIGDVDPAGSGATATRLNDGTVLTVGGLATANASLFDALSETFKSLAFAVPGNPLGDLGYHAATLLVNGKVLISLAATNNYDFAIEQAQIYAAASATFQSTGSMSPARISQSATLLPSGSVLIAGGCRTDMRRASTGSYGRSV